MPKRCAEGLSAAKRRTCSGPELRQQQHVANAVTPQFEHEVVEERLAIHRQEWLWRRGGQCAEPGAKTANKDNRLPTGACGVNETSDISPVSCRRWPLPQARR